MWKKMPEQQGNNFNSFLSQCVKIIENKSDSMRAHFRHSGYIGKEE